MNIDIKQYTNAAKKIAKGIEKEKPTTTLSSEEIEKAALQGLQTALKLLDLKDGERIFISKWSWCVRQSVLKKVHENEKH